MSKKLTSQRVLWYSIIAGVGFILVFAMIYPFVNTAVVPWWNQLLGIETAKEGEAPPGYVYSGNLMVTIKPYDIYDDSTFTATNIVCKIWHADESTLFGAKTTPAGSDDISGQVFATDEGILYLSVDHEATVLGYLDDEASGATTALLTALPPKDVDDDGVLEHYFKIDLSSLGPLSAGQTEQDITIPLYFLDADYDYTITSITNPSSADFSGSTYLDATATAYFADGARGDGCKMVRVELTLPNAGNETYYSDGKVKNVWMSIQCADGKEYKWTNPSFQPAQDRFLVWESTDITQEVAGKQIMFDRNMGDSEVCKISVHIKAANFAATAIWNPTIQITLIDPAGTLQTAETLAITFTDT